MASFDARRTPAAVPAARRRAGRPRAAAHRRSACCTRCCGTRGRDVPTCRRCRRSAPAERALLRDVLAARHQRAGHDERGPAVRRGRRAARPAPADRRFEGQAAMALECAIDDAATGAYPMTVDRSALHVAWAPWTRRAGRRLGADDLSAMLDDRAARHQRRRASPRAFHNDARRDDRRRRASASASRGSC